MGPGPALDAFVQEAPQSHVVIGPDGEVEPGKYDRVAVTRPRPRRAARAARPEGGAHGGAGGLARRGHLGALADPASGVAGAAPDPVPGRRRRLADRAPVRRIGAGAPRGRRARPAGGLARPRRPARPRPGRGGDRQGGRRPARRDRPRPHGRARAARRAGAQPDGLRARRRRTGRRPLRAGLGPRPDRGPGPGPARHLGVHADLPQATPAPGGPGDRRAGDGRVPLSADRVATRVAAHLGEEVTAAITAEVDLADPQAREEHSVVLRRAALTAYSSTAWRTRLGELAGVRVAAQPVGLGRHGHPPPRPAGARARPGRPAARRRPARAGAGTARLRARPRPGPRGSPSARPRGPGRPAAGATRSSATCCTPRANAASGDVVLKMDDDDWYAPDFVADLLLARAYSGAELVGMPDDVYYLEPTDETVRLGQPSEVYRQFVAGGTLMVDRGLLHEVGGFRTVRRHVDAELIAARPRGRRRDVPHPRPRLRAAPHRLRPHLAGRPRRPARAGGAGHPGFPPRTAHGALTAAAPYDHAHAPSFRPRRPAPGPGPAGGLRAGGRRQRHHASDDTTRAPRRGDQRRAPRPRRPRRPPASRRSARPTSCR